MSFVVEFPKSWVERAVVYNSACPNASVDYKPIEATTTRSRYHPKDVQNYKLVCYYTVTSNMNELQAVDIDPFLCTHIIVGFALVHNQIIWIDEDMNKVSGTFCFSGRLLVSVSDVARYS